MLCSHCADIDLTNSDNGYRYALLDFQKMVKSSQAGCEGCEFFLLLAETNQETKLGEYPQSPAGLHVQLRQYGREDNRVDLEFLDRGGSLELRGSIGLRLCSAYGTEASLQATYKRKDEFHKGRVVSQNLIVEGLPLARLISPDSGDRDCLDVAASWIERCSRQHDHCAEQRDVDLPTRLVHIPRDETQNLTLRDTGGRTGRYVALSHCWGSGIAFKTTRETISAWQAGFPLENVARNFQDAVRLTRRFGFEYLWIDALCIVQDSLEDWARESSQMANVYGNASLTISADLAPHSEFGILHPRKVSTSHKFGPNRGLCLQTRGKGWAVMPSMPLTTRGWAFQERILSSRVLHFFEEQIAWECNTTVYLEESHAQQIGHDAHFSKRNFGQALQPPSTSGIKHAPLPTNRSSDDSIDLDVRVGSWNLCVCELAVRQFTDVSDKLPSLSGLASAMEVPELGKYLAGVWEHDPFLSMAWFARWPQSPQIPYRAPSWSWAATMWQLIWYKGWERAATPAEIHAWDKWNSRFAPHLLGHRIIPANSDLKGKTLEGSHITVRGFCREVFVREEANSIFEEWEWIGGNPRRLGRKVHMDSRAGPWHRSWDSKSYFAEDLEDLGDTIDRKSLKRCNCLQITREKGKEYPKILALILESMNEGDNSFRRVGLLAFDDSSAESQSSAWKIQTLKLL